MLIRTRICSYIFCHVRGHGLIMDENFLDRMILVSNAWNLGDIKKDLYPLYLHKKCEDGINQPLKILKLSPFLEEKADLIELQDENYAETTHFCFYSRRDFEDRLVSEGCK